MATVARLCEIPGDISEKYLPYCVTLRQRQNARKFCVESYISSVKIYRESPSDFVVKSCTFSSMKKTEDGYTTVLNINTERKQIVDAVCQCKAGASGECAHVLAVVMKLADWLIEGLQDIPVQPACTTLPQQWDRPRGTKIFPEPVSTMVIAKPGNSNRKRKPLTAVFTDNRKIQLHDSDIQLLQLATDCPLSYLSSMPDQTVQTATGKEYLGSALAYQIPLMQPVDLQGSRTDCGNLTMPAKPSLQIPDFILNDSGKWTNLNVTQVEAEDIEINTRDQSQSNVWHKERANRITASTFGSFMIRKAEMTEKFVRSTVMPKPFKSVSTSYGLNSEKIALNMYRKKTNNHVHECGLVVNPVFPFLGATPDGKICDNGQSGILEIKCPFSIRDWIIQEAVQSYGKKENLFLEESNGSLRLKRTHKHWYQVQGQLLVTGASFCDFVTFTKNDLLIERIYSHSDTMISILTKLYRVYIDFLRK